MNSDSTQWIKPLAARHLQLAEQHKVPTAVQSEVLNTLLLASAIQDKIALSLQQPQLCPQIAILGPTQSGKSSLVNVLLDVQAARASALAGFTVHAQGYSALDTDTYQEAIDTFMNPLRRTPADELNSQSIDTYALETVLAGERSVASDAVIWDTPDFDSIEAYSYRSSALKTAALADISIMIVSKDKYGDKSVWDMLQLLHELQHHPIVVINKLDEPDRQVVEQAFIKRYQQLFSSEPRLILMPFVSGNPDATLTLPDQVLHELAEAINEIDIASNRITAEQRLHDFVLIHEKSWLQPLHRELRSQANWNDRIAEAIDDADEYYATAYLHNPEKYESFNQALAELLTLLEIPGVSNTLGQARKLVTWPARRLLGVGRSVFNNRLKQHAGDNHARDNNENTHDPEADVLGRALDTVLINLQTELLQAPQEPWWQVLNQQFRAQEPAIRERYESRSAEIRKEFEPQIEASAHKLYAQLQTQPALLNTLRAARTTADAAGIALAVKTGGLAPADLILAPAMLSVTSLLTESALGRYLDVTKRQLLTAQRAHVHDKLLSGELGKALQKLANQTGTQGLYTNNIDSDLKAHVMSVFDEQKPSTTFPVLPLPR